MSAPRSLVDVLHWMTHRTPGVPAHRDRPPGHQGWSPHPHPQLGDRVNGRPPRVMVAWQRRIGHVFGQDLD
jgi:hypothetical protein